MAERETEEERATRHQAELAAAPRISEADYRSRSRRSFLLSGVAAVGGYLGFRWVQNAPHRDRIPGVLRNVHELNESIWSTVYREGALAPTFARSESSMIRVNGRHGIREEIDLAAWQLVVWGPDGEELGTHSMEDIRALPAEEMTIEHKCIEGWSHIITWGGTRFSHFAELYRQQLGGPTDFVSLETPDGGYYVGMDWDSIMHPQTMLTYDAEGEPLDQLHGAPLRLTTSLKYGIKMIKRIGVIRFTNEQPPDYWGDRGYDWYAGL